MNKLKEAIRYLLINSTQPSKLTKTKVTKLVYLSDWISSVSRNEQITGVKWYFDHYGPYVSDVYFMAEKDSKIKIESGFNAFGNPKETLVCKITKEKFKSKLNNEEQEILDKVLEKTDDMNWREFIDFVYNTKPIKTSKKYSTLDLISIALDKSSD